VNHENKTNHELWVIGYNSLKQGDHKICSDVVEILKVRHENEVNQQERNNCYFYIDHLLAGLCILSMRGIFNE